MLVTGFPAGAFAANCYIVAPAPGEECVIIDPGQDAERGIEELLARYRLKPVAVLLTHGHIDHVWSVGPVCGAKGIPAWIHPADRGLLVRRDGSRYQHQEEEAVRWPQEQKPQQGRHDDRRGQKPNFEVARSQEAIRLSAATTRHKGGQRQYPARLASSARRK